MEQRRGESMAEGPVDRAFALLQVVVAAREPLGIRELGRRSGLPRSTVSRLVATLERLGMVSRTTNSAVEPGSALATLQTGRTSQQSLSDTLRALLVELVQATSENAAASIDDGDALVYLSGVTGEHPVSVQDVTGERHEFHLVAPGLVTMAFWPADRLDHYLDEPLGEATEFSVTDPSQIRLRLSTIKRDGWAWTDQELDVGVNGLACPVVDLAGELVATVSIFGPSYRFAPGQLPDLGEELATIVQSRSAVLGV